MNTEQAYLQQINLLINELNQAVIEKKQQILQQIKQVDKVYLDTQKMSVEGQVLFSRHGECTSWGQKKYGLSPNTAISEESARSMATTNESTQALLSCPNKVPRIMISPMIRAMQTASFMVPKNMQANISIEPALSENSDTPSGLDIRSNQDLETISKQAPFFSIKRILFFLSNLFYGPKDFQLLNQKRQEAADKIQQHNKQGQTIYRDGKTPQSLNYEGNKIEETQQLIDETTDQDLWLIGHGKNFHAFFKETFGIETNFKFAETRVVYKVNAADCTLYIPPYSLIVNQKTGEIEGRYTGVSKMNIKDVRKEAILQEETASSLSLINGMLSATPINPQNFTEIENPPQQLFQYKSLPTTETADEYSVEVKL